MILEAIAMSFAKWWGLQRICSGDLIMLKTKTTGKAFASPVVFFTNYVTHYTTQQPCPS